MGFFNNYTKPGKGISREEAEKRNYFEIIGRKLGKFIQVNLLYLLCNIVFFGAAAFMVLPLFVANDESISNDIVQYLVQILQSKTLMPILPFVPFMFIGPSTAGLTYVMRNFSRQEHAFVMSDFFEHTKKNFIQGILASLILTFMTYIYITAVIFYLNSGINQTLVTVLSVIIGYLFIITSFYVYPIMVTFKMKLVHIFKNAFLMAFLYMPWNLLTFVAILLVHGLLIWNVPIVWLLLMLIFLIAWSSYTINFTAWSAIDKYLMPKPEAADADEKTE